MEHTPGPWDIILLPSYQYRIDAQAGPLRVCPAIANGLADAYLIHAAPDMLYALEGLNEIIPLTAFKYEGQRLCLQQSVDRARAAIAKAKGRS